MNRWHFALLTVALALAGYAAAVATTRSSVTHRTVAYGLSPAALARAYVINKAAQYEEQLGKLTCRSYRVTAQKYAVTCTEKGPWGVTKTTLDLLHSTWQIVPTDG